MTEPGDEMAARAAGGGHLRASHADREQVIGTLKAAFVHGMLDQDEVAQRVGQTFAARTHADLAALTADIPTRLTAARPPKPARVRGKARVARPVAVLTAATALYAAMWSLALSIHRNMEGNPVPYDGKLILLSTFVYFIVLVFAGVQILACRQENRPGGQPPRRPAAGAGGQASPGLPSVGPGRPLPPADPGHRHATEAAPLGRRLLPN
jgi:hypothetical protein